MHSTSILLCSALLVGALSACTGAIDKVERTYPPTDAFAAALQTGYVALARAEYGENDFRDGRYFAARAKQAATGQVPAPSSLSERRVPSAALPALAAAHDRLTAMLGRGVQPALARDAANAQLAFDCWIQEQEENIQPDEIAACREDFIDAMARLDRQPPAGLSAKPVPLSVRPAALSGREVARDTAGGLKTQYIVYFDFDRHGLTPGAERQIAQAAAAARLTGAAMVRVVGHADRAGPGGHNMSLSRSRAQEVVSALRRLGLPDVGVATQALGEEQPAVVTPDGTRERLNRRVVIELTH